MCIGDVGVLFNYRKVEAAGVEPVATPSISKAESYGYKESPELGAALSTAFMQENPAIATPSDPDLHTMIAAWPKLPESVKKRIMSLLWPGTDGASEGE